MPKSVYILAMNNINIYNNYIHDNAYDGIGINNEDNNPYTLNIYNNIIVLNGRGISGYNWPGNKTFNIFNNTLFHNADSELIFWNTGYTDCLVRNNIIVGTSDILLYYPIVLRLQSITISFMPYRTIVVIYTAPSISKKILCLLMPAVPTLPCKTLHRLLTQVQPPGVPATDCVGVSRPQGLDSGWGETLMNLGLQPQTQLQNHPAAYFNTAKKIQFTDA